MVATHEDYVKSLREERMKFTKEELVGIIEQSEEDERDREDRLQEFICSMPIDNNQQLFELFMLFTLDESWDIPSALGVVCNHYEELFGDGGSEFPMHRSSYWPQNDALWEVIDEHFKEVHGLDLQSSTLNWSFCT